HTYSRSRRSQGASRETKRNKGREDNTRPFMGRASASGHQFQKQRSLNRIKWRPASLPYGFIACRVVGALLCSEKNLSCESLVQHLGFRRKRSFSAAQLVLGKVVGAIANRAAQNWTLATWARPPRQGAARTMLGPRKRGRPEVAAATAGSA